MFGVLADTLFTASRTGRTDPTRPDAKSRAHHYSPRPSANELRSRYRYNPYRDLW